tara:strand:- start:37 stop:303 length:267 start_codon:yes stop_codon:yes gene_type:complete
MNKSIFLTTVEKCLIQDLINIQINEVIQDQRKKNLKDRRNGTLVKGEPIKDLDKWDTDEVYYINQLEKLKKKFKLSNRQETIEQKIYD